MNTFRNYFFLIVFVFYIFFSYFFFPYIASIINTTIVLQTTNQYIELVLFSVLIFVFFSSLQIHLNPIKQIHLNPIKNDIHSSAKQGYYDLLILSYILFTAGFISKIQNVLRGNHKNYLYSNTDSEFFLFEYFFSMNTFTLLSILFFIAIFYNRKNWNINLNYFILPLAYFIFYILFSPGGKINLIIICLLIICYEINRFVNFKLFFFKILSILLISLFLFSFFTIKKDVTIMSQIGIHVLDLNKKMYFTDLKMNNRKITDVLFSKNFVFFTCNKNLMKYDDRGNFTRFKICEKSYGSINTNNISKTINSGDKKINNAQTLINNHSSEINAPGFNVFIFPLYNLSARLNNYLPLNNLLNLLNDNKLSSRPLTMEIKKILYSYINRILKFFDVEIKFERNLEVDNFNVLSGIVSKSADAGVSPTLIGELFWIGGYILIFCYFIKISLFVYLLNYLFRQPNIFYQVISFFFFTKYISTFEQSFEAHAIIFLDNSLLTIACIILYLCIKKFNFYFK